MNSQEIILGVKLVEQIVNCLRLVHKGNHTKDVHDVVSNVINAVRQTARPYIPAPEKTDCNEIT